MKISKRKYVLVFSILLSFFIMISINPAYAIAPMDENFDDDSALSEAGNFTNDGISYTIGGTMIGTLMSNDSTSPLGDDGSDYYMNVGTDTSLTISAESGSSFRLSSFAIDALADTNILITPSSGSPITLVSNNSWVTQTVDLSGNSDFHNITSFTISGSNLILYIDDLDFEEAVLPSYSVTYYGNTNTGGSVPTDGNSYSSGDTVTVLGNTGSLIKTGYTFVGWNTADNGSGTSYTGGDTFSMGNSDVILYAQWSDNIPPDAPQISSITQDLGVSSFDGITRDQTLIIKGTAEANSTVEVYKDSVSIGTTIANGSGNWSFDYTGTSLAEGTYTLTANATDVAGNTGELSSGFTVVIDTTAPAPPVILSFDDDTGVSSDDGITKDNTLIFSGTAEANRYVEIFNADTYDSWGIAQTNGEGNWTITTSIPLTSGDYNTFAVARDLALNTSGLSATYSFTIDTTVPVINSLSPLDNAENVGTNDNLVITFSENVYTGTGNITIKNSSDNSLVETIDVTGGKVTGADTNIITINPSTTLEGSTGYYIQIDATAFSDIAGNNFSGIADATTWNFTTEINNYTVTFKDYNGTTLKAETVEHGSSATAPTDPTRVGYTFSGWDVDYSNVTEDLTATAQWTAIDYTVTYDGNINTGGAAPTDGNTYNITDTVTVLGNTGSLVKTGYTFAGWNTAANGSGISYSGGDTFAMGSSNVTLYAQWTEKTYSVTYDGNGNTGGTVPVDGTTYHAGDTATVLGNTGSLVRTGYTFNVWNTVANGTGTSYTGSDTFAIGTSNVTLYAQYNVNQYTVTFDSQGGSAVGPITADYGSLITAPTAPTKTGYDFGGWYKEAGLTTEWDFGTDTVPASDITLYVKWTIKEYTVTFEDYDGTTLKTETVEHGSGATAPADLTREGHTFLNWSVPFNDITSNLTVRAVYDAITHQVRFLDHDGTEINTQSVEEGQSATAPDNPTREGYTFTGWDPSDFSNITSSLEIIAQYSVNQYTITFESNGGSAIGPVTADYGSLITAPTAPTKSGYDFAGWYKEAALTTAWDFSTDKVLSADITLYGKWSSISSGGSSSGSSSNRNSDSTDDGEGNNEQEENTIVIVNGQEEKAGTESVTEELGEKIAEVKLDSDVIDSKIEEVIRSQSQDIGETQSENIIEVPILTQDAKNMTTILTGDIVKKMDENNFRLSILSEAINYVIPAKEVGIESVAKNLDVEVENLKEIEIEVKINTVDEKVTKEIEERAKAKDYEIVFPPMSFEVVANTKTTSGEEKQLTISKFNQYVQRVMKLPEGIDPSKITTGIVYNEDGTFSHVPTSVFMKDGIYYAKINSLTNSSYSAIWNPVIVLSVENHWSKEAVNDMASRLVIKNPEVFIPNQEITRGEFAEYITKALGIYRTGVENSQKFSDVETSHELTDAIQIASEYGIISGYPDGSFKPSAKISREEAMVMYSRAMDIAGLEEVDNNRIENYIDKAMVADWAYNDVKKAVSAGVFNGKTNETINPKETFTCAEAATAIRNLLVVSGLINN